MTFFQSRPTFYILGAALCLLLAVLPLASSNFIGVYGGGPFYSGNNDNIGDIINDLKSSGFTAVILWAIHVDGNSGDLHYNDQLIASNGQYVGDSSWPDHLNDLLSGDTSVQELLLSVGSAGVGDFQSIQNLINQQGTGSDSILYRNFAALKQALPISKIDLDDEDDLDGNTLVQFSLMMGQVGFSVSLCPYYASDFWTWVLQTLNQQAPGLVSQVNLQCYSGGSGNDPNEWQQTFNQGGVNVPVYPGLWCNQDDAGSVQNMFSSWRDGGINGGFMWLYDDIRDHGLSTSDFAHAIAQGVGA